MGNLRKLPPTEVLRQVLAGCLRRHVGPAAHIIVGLSGGIDSVVLLHALVTYRQQDAEPFSLAALHVNHDLSPKADSWAEFCAKYAVSIGVPCHVTKVAVERNSRDGLEAAARRARYAAFAASTADWIMLAHQRDDQAETLLFNLLRGTGIAGAAAMRERSGRLLRPFLPVGRDVIADYAKVHRLEWVDDESNADIRHSRNFLRHRILAPLQRRFPSAGQNLAAAATRFAETEELLDTLARSDLGDSDDFPLPAKLLRRLSEPRARNVLRHLLARHGVSIPSEVRLREALRQMLTAGQDRHPRLAFGRYSLSRRRDLIYLESVEVEPASR